MGWGGHGTFSWPKTKSYLVKKHDTAHRNPPAFGIRLISQSVRSPDNFINVAAEAEINR